MKNARLKTRARCPTRRYFFILILSLSKSLRAEKPALSGVEGKDLHLHCSNLLKLSLASDLADALSHGSFSPRLSPSSLPAPVPARHALHRFTSATYPPISPPSASAI